MFTLHRDRENIGDHRFYFGNFETVNTDNVEVIAKIVSTFVSSPIQWHFGRRKRTNFLAANWLGLDFDEGTTLQDGLERFQKFTHIIGTTKSHQLPKGQKPPCDRFRVFLKLPITITSCPEYEALLRAYVNHHMADFQATDGARIFHPCKQIISAQNGECAPLLKKKKYVPKVRAAPGTFQGIPRWVTQLLNFGVGYAVSRNTTCFKIAVHLKKAGYSHAEIVEMLMASPIPIGPEVRGEVEDAVKSAMKYS